MITRDNATVTSGAIAFYSVIDAARAANEVAKLQMGITDPCLNARSDDSRGIAIVNDGSAPARGDMLEVTGADGATLIVRLAPASLLLKPVT